MYTLIKNCSLILGHLPGRSYVNPGKTFCQEVDALLTTFHPKSAAVVPISRHTFTSALQQMTNDKPEGNDDPYFDNRPPSTYLNNYPIPGYQGFVPRVRTSTSSLGIRYIKAVEKSLHALHEQNQYKKSYVDLVNEEIATSPKKLLDRRPLHTPRHRPHPKPKTSDENDWRVIYNRPPSTYLDSSKTFIPGYKGFIPHLRGSPNAVGVRYSKAALRCVEKSNKSLDKQEKSDEINNQQAEPEQSEPKHKEDEQENREEKKENEMENDIENYDQIKDYGDTGSDSDNGIEEEIKRSLATETKFQSKMEEDRPYRAQHSDYFRDRKPSTYKSDERHPIPGYQGFIPRLRDSPTTLGLRYTKAALKTLEDVHKIQRTHER